MKVDVRIKSYLDLDLTGDTYKLAEVVWMDPDESRGLHHIFVDVVDQDGHRLAGEKLWVRWSGGEAVIPVEEKPGEPWGGNYAMYATMGSYAVEVVAGSGGSDRVAGLGMGTPEEPGVKHHTSFGLRFVLRPDTEPVPDLDEPEIVPGDGEIEELSEPEEGEPVMDKPEKFGGPQVDPRIESLLELDLTGDTYKLTEVVWMDPDESRGLHHIFVDVVDRDGRRLAGEKLRVRWSDGEAVIPVEEKPGEPWGGNYAMYATMGSYSAEVVAGSGASDRVAGLGMGTPEEPGVKHHTSFGLRFVLRPGPETEPEADEPQEVPAEEEDVEPEKPVEEPAGPSEAGDLVVDPRIESLLELDLTGDTYKLTEVVWMDPDESRGLHHIFVDVVDRDGRRLAGEKLRVRWSGGEAVSPVEEKPGEPWGGNYAMYATMGSYSAEVVAGSGASDRVAGLGMGTPEEPGVKHHTSFGLRFRKRNL